MYRAILTVAMALAITTTARADVRGDSMTAHDDYGLHAAGYLNSGNAAEMVGMADHLDFRAEGRFITAHDDYGRHAAGYENSGNLAEMVGMIAPSTGAAPAAQPEWVRQAEIERLWLATP